jgi:hypothetical protein
VLSRQTGIFYPGAVYRITRMKQDSSGGILILRDMRGVQNVQVGVRTQRKAGGSEKARPAISRLSGKRIKCGIVFSGYQYPI